MFNEAVQALIDNIKNMVIQMLKNADYDRTYTGRVKEVKQMRTGLYTFLYTVTISGVDYSIKSKFKYSVGDYVLVLVPRSNWGCAKLIATGNEGTIETKEITELKARIAKLESKLSS